MKTIENAKIASTTLGFEDHGLLTFFLHLSGDGWGVGWGGHCIEGPWASKIVRAVLQMLQVSTWEEVSGQFVRVETAGAGHRVTRIGHFMRDEWIDLDTFFEEEASE